MSGWASISHATSSVSIRHASPERLVNIPRPTPEHRNYGAGYLDIPVDLHDALVLATLESLAEQGSRRIVVWRGCGGHDLRETVMRFNEAWDGQSRAFLPGLPYHKVWCRIADPSIPGGHADSFTTLNEHK